MPGGPIFPNSAFPTNVRVFPNVHLGAGAGPEDDGLGVTDATLLDVDSTWRLRFQLPVVIPGCTAKLRILSLANAVTGVVNVNPKWASVAPGEDPSSATLNAEGTTSITWAAGDADEYKETKIDLDADTLVALEVLAMDLVFEDVGMTIAVVSTHIVSIIWE